MPVIALTATATKEDLHMIAVVMGAEDPKKRFQDAQTLLAYGFGVSDIYIDENQESLPDHPVENGVEELVPLKYEGTFRYLDVTGKNLENMEKEIRLPQVLSAPLDEGQIVGKAVYRLDGKEIGSVNILSAKEVLKAKYIDYLKKIFGHFLLGDPVVR